MRVTGILPTQAIYALIDIDAHPSYEGCRNAVQHRMLKEVKLYNKL